MNQPVCYFCGGQITVNDHLVFCDEEKAPYKRPTIVRTLPDGLRTRSGELAYPTNGEHSVIEGEWSSFQRIGFFAHPACGPRHLGYCIKVSVLDNMDWDNHILMKNWYCPAVKHMLAVGREFLRANKAS